MLVAVLGADGCVGQRLAPALDALGAELVPVGRNGAVTAPVEAPLLVAAGASQGCRPTIQSEIARGRDIVDVHRDAGHLVWLHDQVAPGVRTSGARVVGGAGLRWAVGDLLTSVAAAELERVEEVHVAYPTGGGREVATPGERRDRLVQLGMPALARVDGRTVDEPPGAERRLAWFPRPVGPSHAAGVPGGEVLTVPLHLPGARTVRTYEAVPSWRAEWLQAEANLARTAWGRRRLARWLARERPVPGQASLAGRRWGCVVEATDGVTLVRAWAYGHDPVQVTAELGALLVTRLADAASEASTGSPGAGPVAPSQVTQPSGALDHLAVRTDLRWSVNRIELPGR